MLSQGGGLSQARGVHCTIYISESAILLPTSSFITLPQESGLMPLDFVSLPPELISSIVDLLPFKDLRNISCVSSFVRQVVVPLLFRSVLLQASINGLEDVRGNIKQAIE